MSINASHSKILITKIIFHLNVLHKKLHVMDTRIQGYKSDNYFIEFTIVIILK